MVVHLRDAEGKEVRSIGVSSYTARAPPEQTASEDTGARTRGGGLTATRDAYCAGILDDFTEQYQFLHPDAPCCVALPVTVGPMGEFHSPVFYPSWSCAVYGGLLDLTEDREDFKPDREMLKQLLGAQDLPYEDEAACKAYMSARTDELKDSLKQEGLLTILQNMEGFSSAFVELLECLTRDKFFRTRRLGADLVETAPRQLKFESDFGRNELVTPQLLHEAKRDLRMYDRILMKVREDMRHPVRGVFRWLYQSVPVEFDLRRRPFLYIGETESADPDGRPRDFVLRSKLDQRQYYVNREIDNSHVFERFPASEREDMKDDESMRRKKRLRLADELVGGGADEQRRGDAGPSPALLLCFGQNARESEIPHEGADRFHAAVVALVRGVFVVVDLNSTSGTMFDGKRLTPSVFHRVTPGNNRTHELTIANRTYTVRCGGLHKDELIRAKRRELEQRLKQLEAGFSQSSARPTKERGDSSRERDSARQYNLIITGLPAQFTPEDLESMLLQNQLKFLVSAPPPALSTPAQQTPRRLSSYTYMVCFQEKTEAWRAKEFFNGRIVRGRSLTARLEVA